MEKYLEIKPGSKEHRLLECCRTGTLEEMRALLEAGAEVNAYIPFMDDLDAPYVFGQNDLCGPIHTAAENPDIRVIQLLVAHGADVSEIDVYGNTPLCYAAKQNTLEMVLYLVSLGNDPLYENDDGDNLLTASACNPHKDVLEYFFQQGVDIDGCSDINPLGIAMRYGTIADMDFFLEHGADLEQGLAYGGIDAPLKNLRHLLERGCNVNVLFPSGDQERCRDRIERCDDERLQLFLEFGATIAGEVKRKKKESGGKVSR